MITPQELDDNGYFEVREINGKTCALLRMMFTVGLVYGIDEIGYEGRYCYERLADAKEALNTWDGQGEPTGPWIKHKGYKGDYSNPNTHK